MLRRAALRADTVIFNKRALQPPRDHVSQISLSRLELSVSEEIPRFAISFISQLTG